MSIIATLPVTLQNGQIADATQVMADLNQIVNNVNANAASLNGSNNFLTGSTQAVGGDVIVTATASQTLTNKSIFGYVPVINSVSLIRSLLKTGNPAVFVIGYYTPFDGGGGSYAYDSTDTTSADNGGTIIVATDGGRWKLAQPGAIDARQFGAKLNGSTDDTAAVAAFFAAMSGTGKLGTFNGPACLLSSTVSLNNLGSFNIDFMQCAISCTQASGVYVFDMTQASFIGLRGGKFTGNGVNNFVKTAGSTAAQAIYYPLVPIQSLWSQELRFSDSQIYGFSIAFDMQNYSREIWIDRCAVLQNVIAVRETGTVINVGGSNNILYSTVAASQSIVVRTVADALDVQSNRYAQGNIWTGCVSQSVGTSIQVGAGLVFKYTGNQVYSTTLGLPGVSITATSNGANPQFLNQSITIDALLNSGISVGVGNSIATNFAIDIRGTWSGIQGTAAIISALSQGVRIGGQFTAGSGTVVGCAIGANCVNINFYPDALDSTYVGTPLTVVASSVQSVRANYSTNWTPTITFGGASVGVTYGVQAGRMIWNGGTITYQWQITLSSKGTSTGVLAIGGIPFTPNVNCAGSLSDFNTLNTAFTPVIGLPAGSFAINVKTGAGGSTSQFSNTDLTNTSTINGQVVAMVS